MKKRKFKKLQLNKSVISRLSDDEQFFIKGGFNETTTATQNTPASGCCTPTTTNQPTLNCAY